MRILALCLIGLLPLASVWAADGSSAAELYAKNCAECHDQGAGARVPSRAALEKLTPALALRALTTGVMRDIGAKLTSTERSALAAYLGKAETVKVDQGANRCNASPALGLPTNMAGWSGWGAGLENWRFQSAAGAGLSAADVPKLKLKWAFGVPDATSMRSQPAVYAGRVFVAGGTEVYSLDAKTGCVYWSTSTASAIRSGITIAPVESRALAIFGDAAGQVRALDASTGDQVWQARADDHPATMVTGTPVFYRGRLYVGASSSEDVRAGAANYLCCTFRGSVQALDASTGNVIWKTYTIPEAARAGKATKRGAKTMGPSGAGVWTAPTIDPEHNAIYVTTGDNYSEPVTANSDAVLALALDSGKILWSKQLTDGDAFNFSCLTGDKPNCPNADGPGFCFGSSPILMRINGNRRVLVLGQKSGMLHGIDPDRQGKILWQTRVGRGGLAGGIQWGSATDGSRVYVALSDLGVAVTPTGLKLGDPLHGGGMFAFLPDNGERVLMTPPAPCGDRQGCSPAQSQAVSAIPGAVFSGSKDGHFRAYSTADGKVIWDYDTIRDYQTVNGIPAKGGALDAGGPVIANSMVFVGSGYTGLPGNVLLAFGKE